MKAIAIIAGILAIGLGGFGFLNTIFLWVPMLVQGHAVTGTSGSKNTALRVGGAVISLAVIAGGIALIVSAAS